MSNCGEWIFFLKQDAIAFMKNAVKEVTGGGGVTHKLQQVLKLLLLLKVEFMMTYMQGFWCCNCKTGE